MSENLKNFIKMINDPKEINGATLTDLVNEFTKKKQAINIEYDGLTICQLSGCCIGEKPTIKLEIKPGLFIVVLKDKFKEIIEKHCLINEVFDKSYSKIFNISILDT